MAFDPGEQVHVANFGKGVVREVRNGGRYLVDIKGAAMVVAEGQLSAVEQRKRSRRASAPPFANSTPEQPSRANIPASIDLHGMTAAEAETAIDAFLNDAILGGLAEVRVIHGRSGGRVKATVHTRLKQLPSVRGYRVDLKNPGVTIVSL